MTEEAVSTTAEPSAPVGDGGDPAAPPSTGSGAARRRRRRGGRGRGGRGRSTAAAGSSGGGGGAPGDQPEVDLDGQPGETERVGTATIAEGDAAPTTSTARRRRRGGRGRGGRGGAKPAGADSTESDGKGDVAKGTASVAAGKASETGRPETDGDAAAGTTPRTRRRRGGRGRGGRGTTSAATADVELEPSPGGTTEAKPARGRATSGRAKAAASGRAAAAKAKEAPAEAPTSTRLKRQRQSRQVRRRRDVTPAVERVTDKLMVITEHGERDQIAVLEGRDLVQHYVTRQGARSMVGNVYLGRVQNVLPGMEAAFVDVGRGRNAVLYAGEVNWSPEDLEGAPARIEHVLKSGQSVLVQVTKDPIGGKGARLTAQISLPGRFLVLAPNSNVTGVSRRLPDGERRRLKTIYRRIKPDAHGLIVRTAAEGASDEALTADLERLLEEWKAIEKRSKRAKAPAVLYEEPELTVRVVRDLFTDEEYRELVTDSPRIFRLITDYLRDVAPDILAKVRLHEGPLSAFEEFHIVEQIHKGLDRKVWLPSGGYVIIERTEALTVIDVNTGKSVGKTNLEETVVNTNVEAAREIARQLRLRDIGGMIVIDFIDMLLEQNKSKVIDAMKEALAQDKSRSQVFDISPLGLLEVTRKRVSGGLLDAFSETCPTCEGRGVLLTYDVN
jgi:ribonuclease E